MGLLISSVFKLNKNRSPHSRQRILRQDLLARSLLEDWKIPICGLILWIQESIGLCHDQMLLGEQKFSSSSWTYIWLSFIFPLAGLSWFNVFLLGININYAFFSFLINAERQWQGLQLLDYECSNDPGYWTADL